MSPIVVVGGGFAGVWSALAAARRLDEEGAGRAGGAVTLVSADPYLTIRPRLYEADARKLRIPLDRLLLPVGVRRIEARVTAVDPLRRELDVEQEGRPKRMRYDRLVLAPGSQVVRPPVPGLAGHAFDVDSYRGAQRLEEHLRSLSRHGGPSRLSAVVIGAGFTGLEVATELVGRLTALATSGERVQLTLVESAPEVGPDLGPGPRPVILAALRDLGIGLRLGQPAVAIDAAGVTLASGEHVPAATTVWTAGLRASSLAAEVGTGTDPLGRVPVDRHLWAAPGLFAAGDVARAMADVAHPAPMSCQHAIPMGKFAGHNAAADLLGGSLLAYEQTDYVTCLDLGAAGAVFTRGWERHVVYTGATGKRLKEQINRRDIVPPLTGRRRDLLDAARPESPSMDGLVALGEQMQGPVLARR